MNSCPSLDALEAGGPAVQEHLPNCAACRSVVELLQSREEQAAEISCARAELLLATSGREKLQSRDARHLASHLAGCPICREAALDPAEAGEESSLPSIAPETYALGSEIGRGGMGRVIAARDRRIGRAVALKEVLASDAAAQARFEREARITARLQHPGIIAVYEIGRWPDGRPFFAMPLLPGRTLREAIAAAPTPAERLRLLPAVIDAADAVAYAHSHRIVHRDLTPANVVLGSFGETTVIDWGLAKDLDAVDSGEAIAGGPGSVPGDLGLTATGAVVGTPAYLAPEQAEGRRLDARADVYALGAILHHVLAGSPPHHELGAGTMIRGKRARWLPRADKIPSVPADLQSVSARAMAIEPSDRYDTAADFVADLKRFQAGERVSAHRYGMRERVARWLSRRLLLVGATSSLLALTGLTVAVGALQVVRERRRTEDIRVQLERNRMELESSKRRLDPMAGWFPGGNSEVDYDIGIDDKVRFAERPTAYLRSKSPDLHIRFVGGVPAFGTLMQNFDGTAFRGRRVRLSALVKTEAVKFRAGLWMTVIGDRKSPVAFDNMANRPISGTTDWRRHEVVLDVPPAAIGMAVGVMLVGAGRVWMTDSRLEVVDTAIPTTGYGLARSQEESDNLDFRELQPGASLPEGWNVASSDPRNYRVEVDPKSSHLAAAAIRMTGNARMLPSGGFVTMTNMLRAPRFRGHRVRFSAYVRTTDVRGRAGLTATIGEDEVYDDMSNRPIKGTTPWRKYELVLDFSEHARVLTIGVALQGDGVVWLAHPKLEVVDDAVALTGGPNGPL